MTRLAVAASLLLAPAPSGAQVGGFEVPAECGSELEFTAELERLVGADAARARPSLLRIERDAATNDYRLTLEVGGQRRELEHADCRVLFRSAAVISAASIKASAPPPAEVPPPAAPKREVARGADADAGGRRSASRARFYGEVGLGAGVALGVLPGTAGMVDLRAGLVHERWGVTLAGRYYFPEQTATVEGRSAEISGFGLRAAGVALPWPWLSGSLGFDVDRLSGRGTSGVSNPTTDSAWTLAPSLEIALIPLQNEHLALELAAAGRVALVRPVFEVNGFRELYQVPSFGMTALARGVFRFR
jgi:hypothetical protein